MITAQSIEHLFVHDGPDAPAVRARLTLNSQVLVSEPLATITTAELENAQRMAGAILLGHAYGEIRLLIPELRNLTSVLASSVPTALHLTATRALDLVDQIDRLMEPDPAHPLDPIEAATGFRRKPPTPNRDEPR